MISYLSRTYRPMLVPRSSPTCGNATCTILYGMHEKYGAAGAAVGDAGSQSGPHLGRKSATSDLAPMPRTLDQDLDTRNPHIISQVGHVKRVHPCLVLGMHYFRCRPFYGLPSKKELLNVPAFLEYEAKNARSHMQCIETGADINEPAGGKE